MRILVVGAGPVGVVTACGYGALGHFVTLFEINHARAALLSKGTVDFYEPGLQKSFLELFHSKKLTIADSLAQALTGPIDVIFVCVGTPGIENSGRTDLSFLNKFITSFIKIISAQKPPENDGELLLIIKSTVPVGTTEKLALQIKQKLPGVNISIAFSPEFLSQGSAVQDFQNPDRIVFGATTSTSPRAIETFKKLHAQSPLSEKIIVVSSESAELSKYASNFFLAMKITFANQIANFAKASGANAKDVLTIVGKDRRIGEQFLRPGPGFGGSCFPKDLLSLACQSKQLDLPLGLVKATIDGNRAQHKLFLDKIIQIAGPMISTLTVGILGLAFKPNTNDLRSSPGMFLADALAPEVGCLLGYDPLVDSVESAKIVLTKSLEELLEKSQLIVLTTDDQGLAALLLKNMGKPLKVIDCRDVLPQAPNIIKI